MKPMVRLPQCAGAPAIRPRGSRAIVGNSGQRIQTVIRKKAEKKPCFVIRAS